MEADLVCFHAFSSTMPKTIEYINRIKAQRPEVPIIIGGTHASVMAEDTLQYCDIVVRQEGDETLPEVLDRLKNDQGMDGVLGVSYWDRGEMKQNPNRPFAQHFDVIPDLELISGYMNWPTTTGPGRSAAAPASGPTTWRASRATTTTRTTTSSKSGRARAFTPPNTPAPPGPRAWTGLPS
jgi:radical SAM superfamily enzyme YgiQ (UPF0313 family)